jgi:uncharacterized protein (DUF608 family)
MKKTSCHSSRCGCNPGGFQLKRRDFLKLAGTLAAGAAFSPFNAVAGPFEASDFDYTLIPADKKLSAAWLRSLMERGEPAVYRGTDLDLIGMPVGGICAGQLYLGGDGHLWHWDIFNDADSSLFFLTLGPHYQEPLKPAPVVEQGFALKVKDSNGEQVRPLDKIGFPKVSFLGQYPIGTVTYRDEACPVEVVLEAYSPFIPLNADDSGLPATVMEFTVKNTSAAPVEVEIAGWLENVICRGTPVMRGAHVDTNAGWLDNSVDRTPWSAGKRRNRVARSGGTVRVDASATGGRPDDAREAPRPDIVFEDFEGGSYSGWTVEGAAFGARPVMLSELPADQTKSLGAHGQAFADSRAGAIGGPSDLATGKLISQPFKIKRRFIKFLIGGGADPDKLGVRLVVDGKVVRSTSGNNEGKLRLDAFDAREFEGQEGHLEIVDDRADTQGWGHTSVDYIVFTDEAGEPISASDAPDFGTLSLALLSPGRNDRASAEVEASSAAQVFHSLDQGGVDKAEKPFSLNPSQKIQKLVGAVSRQMALPPGAEQKAVFFIAWHFPSLKYTSPIITDAWNQIRDFEKLKRYYAKQFRNAAEVSIYLAKNFARLSSQTKLWRQTWYDSTLPHWLLDRTFGNLSTLATATCHRFDNGRYWFWEGVYCCQGCCMHVWHYAQGIARIFPQIERDLRERVDYGISFKTATGEISNRGEYEHTAAIDGQAGVILRTLREHQMAPDSAFLHRNWPRIKRAVEWLVAQDGADGAVDGLITCGQPNTLDATWYGPVPWLSSLYVAALKAGAAMAGEMKDQAAAERWEAISKSGADLIRDKLFHKDQYFVQRLDPRHADQFGSGYGCQIDQVFGQGWAWQVGLGRVLSGPHTRKALRSLWRYNFTPDVGPFRHGNRLPAGRWFAMPGEGGMVMCTFPDPEHPKPFGDEAAGFYGNECWTGCENQIASHMIWEGGDFIENGLAVVRMLHDRHHPSKRNPWNEVECGDHYGRALSSYGVFTAVCGFEYHGPNGHIGFAPRLSPEDFQAAFTAAEGWGTYRQKSQDGRQKAELAVKWGRLRLKTLALVPDPALAAPQAVVTLADQPLAASLSLQDGRAVITLAKEINLPAGQNLKITLRS